MAGSCTIRSARCFSFRRRVVQVRSQREIRLTGDDPTLRPSADRTGSDCAVGAAIVAATARWGRQSLQRLRSGTAVLAATARALSVGWRSCLRSPLPNQNEILRKAACARGTGLWAAAPSLTSLHRMPRAAVHRPSAGSPGACGPRPLIKRSSAVGCVCNVGVVQTGSSPDGGSAVTESRIARRVPPLTCQRLVCRGSRRLARRSAPPARPHRIGRTPPAAPPSRLAHLATARRATAARAADRARAA